MATGWPLFISSSFHHCHQLSGSECNCIWFDLRPKSDTCSILDQLHSKMRSITSIIGTLLLLAAAATAGKYSVIVHLSESIKFRLQKTIEWQCQVIIISRNYVRFWDGYQTASDGRLLWQSSGLSATLFLFFRLEASDNYVHSTIIFFQTNFYNGHIYSCAFIMIMSPDSRVLSHQSMC